MSQGNEPRRLARRAFLRRSLVAGGAVVGGVLAACQQSVPSVSPTAAPAAPAPTAAPAAAPAAPAAPAVKPGEAAKPAEASKPAEAPKPAAPAPAKSQLDSWTVALQEDITNLDPVVEANGAIHWNVKFHIFEPLVGFEGPELRLTPRLAESWSYTNDNTLEMKLRQNVKWHNGDDFTADDVLYTFQMHKSNAKLGTGYVFDRVDKLEQIDSHTIRFTTKTPVASFLPFSAQLFVIVPRARDKIGAEAFNRRPIGTGMYKVAQDWARDQPVQLAANEAYWGGPPSPARLQFKFIREPSTRVAELQNGNVQIAQSIPLPQVELLRRGANTDVTSIKGARVMYQSINYGREPFSNPKVRLAMNYAVDRDIITKNVLQGFGQPLVGLFAPGFLGYNGPKLEPYTFNPTKAKQLLTEAGLPNGFQFEWQTTDGVFVKDREIAEAVAAQLKQANITANIKILERATIYDNVFSGNFELVAGQWGTDVDPDRYLQWIFVRTLGVKDAAATAPVLEMMNDGIKIIDPAKRQAKYEELSKLAYEQALLLFVHIQDDVYGIDKRTGWSPYSVRAQATNQFFALHPSLKRG